MLEHQSVAFVGSGTMAEAIIKAILDHDLVPQHQITGSDPRADRGEELAARYGIHVTTDNTAAVSQAAYEEGYNQGLAEGRTAAAATVAAACPFCATMLSDGLMDKESAIVVKDIAELVDEATA